LLLSGTPIRFRPKNLGRRLPLEMSEGEVYGGKEGKGDKFEGVISVLNRSLAGISIYTTEWWSESLKRRLRFLWERPLKIGPANRSKKD